jgi:hypothetical protein
VYIESWFCSGGGHVSNEIACTQFMKLSSVLHGFVVTSMPKKTPRRTAMLKKQIKPTDILAISTKVFRRYRPHLLFLLLGLLFTLFLCLA